MLHRPLSRPLFIGAVALLMATLPGPAPADVYFETSYLPTSSVVLSSSVLPTSYVIPTAYSSLIPTAYSSSSVYLPTSYLATSSVLSADSVVYPTSTTVIRRSFLRPRRFVERTYYSSPLLSTSYALPTTYVTSSSLLPTSYLARSTIAPTSFLVDDRVIATSASSSYPCETTSSSPVQTTSARPANSNSNSDSGNTIVSSPSSVTMSNERRPQGTVSSTPGSEEAPSTFANPPASKEIPAPETLPKKAETPTPPPAQPLEERKPEDINMPLPGEAGKSAPKINETSMRTARRPNYDGRNILRGRVISADTRQPEEGVTVIVSNVTKNFGDRPAMTDADGEFKVSLPDGDWIVKVKMPSGSVYAVGRNFVTASSGRVTDSSGRNVTEFLITR